eukprot:sb/3474284/
MSTFVFRQTLDSSDGSYTVETHFLTINESDCTDTTDSEWTTVTAGTDYCSSSELSDRPDCTLPSGATTESTCEASGLCCWDNTNSKCVASSKYVCDIDGLSDALLNSNNYAIYKEGTKLTDDNWSSPVQPQLTVTQRPP